MHHNQDENTIRNGRYKIRPAEVADKPQGFKDAQRARRGKYVCALNCGAIFDKVEEAHNIKKCPNWQILDEERKQLYEASGLNREVFLEQAKLDKIEEHRSYRKLLRNLPRTNKHDAVIQFINSCNNATN